MNDIVLSGLVNIFALLGSSLGYDKNKTLELIGKYLKCSFGVREPQSYLNLYRELRDFYDDFPADGEKIVDDICSRLQAKIDRRGQNGFFLRLLEFAGSSGNLDAHHPIIEKVAVNFGIGNDLYDDYVRFINGEACANVLTLDLPGGASLKTIRDGNFLAFSYDGPQAVTMNDIPVSNGVFQVWQQSGVLKGKDFAPMYYSTIMQKYEGVETGGVVHLCGRDVDFRFDETTDNGMHNLSFSLRSGQLVAIMGGSGVGKSTLLSLLTGSIRPQKGSITINGHSISSPETKALIGFVPQDDLLVEELTVYQNLWYTAKLCFDGMSEEELDSCVRSTLKQLDLEAASDLKVGSPINKYISGGQRKRLNIALELIREPAVLFLDEPTSGLSSSDAERVVNLLKEQAGKGKLIIVNIHQPSSDIYKLFDRLWVLDKGGYPIFDGNPIEAVSYFKKAANYADADITSCPTCGNVNPEQMLGIIDEKALDASGNLTDRRVMTPQQWHQLYLDGRSAFPPVSKEPVPGTRQARPGRLKQMWIFLRRNISAKMTNLQYILVTFLEAPLLAAISAALTRYVPDSGVYTVLENKNLTSYLFMAVIVSIFLGMSGSAEEIIRDRALQKREKFLDLSYGSYIWSKIIYMAAICLVQTGLFIVVGNTMMGLHGLFWVWWMILFISAFLSGLIGLLLSQCLNSVVAIYITIPLLLIPQILLCGLVVDFSDLNPKSETGNVPVLGDIIPSRWAYEALAVSSYTMNSYEAPLYQSDREKYQALYFEASFVYELESRMETRRDEIEKGKEENPVHLRLIKTELPYLAEEICGMEPYDGDYSYDSLHEYIQRAKKILSAWSNSAVLSQDREMKQRIREVGMDNIMALKTSQCNTQLENLVLGRSGDRIYSVVGSHIVPRSGFVFLDPRTRNGRAPFYSGIKYVGNAAIPTLWFNISVMILMCMLAGACLLSDFPGKYVR